jgi:hypothetical protein
MSAAITQSDAGKNLREKKSRGPGTKPATAIPEKPMAAAMATDAREVVVFRCAGSRERTHASNEVFT